MLFDVPQDVLNVVAFLAFMAHAIHIVRLPTFWAKILQEGGTSFNIPNWVFFPAWMTVILCDAVFGVLFYMGNTVTDGYYNASVWVYLSNWLLLLTWNWLYFNVICLYAVAMIGIAIFLTHVALLVLTILYGGQTWFVILIISAPIAWTAFAAFGSLMIGIKKAAKLSELKKQVGKLSEAVYTDANKKVKTSSQRTPKRP